MKKARNLMIPKIFVENSNKIKIEESEPNNESISAINNSISNS